MNDKTNWQWQHTPAESDSIALYSNEGGGWQYEFHLRAGTTTERADKIVRIAYHFGWQAGNAYAL